jgi:hypothetical protein
MILLKKNRNLKLKFFTHFGTPRALAQLTHALACRLCYQAGEGRHDTTLAAAAGRSYRETIRDGVGNTFTPKLY